MIYRRDHRSRLSEVPPEPQPLQALLALGPGRQLLPGPIGGAVIDDHDLAGDPVVVEDLERLAEKLVDARLLVVTRDHDFFFHRAAPPEIYTLSLHDALPI